MSGKALRKRLSAKEVPFLVTLFLAWAGWAIAHMVDRVIESPTVEYEVVTSIHDGKKKTGVRLANLSRQAFFGLAFEIHGKDVVACLPLENKDPAWVWDAPPEKTPMGVKFVIAQLHPGWEATFCALSEKDTKTSVVLKDGGTGKDASKQAIRLVKPSLETRFVRNELCLMIWLTIVAAALAVLWLVFAHPQEGNSR